MLELQHLIQPVTLFLVSVVGWGVRALLSRQKELDRKIDALRKEFHAEMHEYVRNETCQARCEALHQQIKDGLSVHGFCMQQRGLAFVDINDPVQMHKLHDEMTPEQWREHARSCQFRSDMEG